jgi:hypothetical protein
VLDGSFGRDIVIGGNGADVLIGGPGDTLTGDNGGPDTYLFRPGFGANTITDFDVNIDVIQIDKSIFSSVADLLSHTSDTAAGAVIDDGKGDTITLKWRQACSAAGALKRLSSGCGFPVVDDLHQPARAEQRHVHKLPYQRGYRCIGGDCRSAGRWAAIHLRPA